MSRSIWKVNLIDIYKEKIKDTTNDFEKNIFKTKSRNGIITDNLLNKKISIYNGNRFINVFVDQLKIGHKFGEFSFTRKKYKSKKKKKK